MAIVAFVLALAGLVLAFIPFITWFSGALLLAAFIVGLIALLSKKQGGKGLSIASIIISVVGWIVSLVVSIASFGLLADASRDYPIEDSGSIPTEPAPSTEGDEPEDVAGDVQDLAVIETAFGQTTADPSTWWYVVVIENPNADYIFDFASVDIEAIDASGTILDTASEYLTLLNGKTAITGYFFSVGQGEVLELDVRGPLAAEATPSPAAETGAFTIEGLAATGDEYSTSVTGTVSGTFDTEQQAVRVTVIARGADGWIIGGESTYIERLPVGGGKVQFETTFIPSLPADATFEAFGSL